MHFHGTAILLCLTTTALSAPVWRSHGVNQDIASSCRAFEVPEDGHTLKATCQYEVDAEIDTNNILGTNNGLFDWNRRNWWADKSGDRVLLLKDWTDRVVLQAGLINSDKTVTNAVVVNLDEHIRNFNGTLIYTEVSPHQTDNTNIIRSCRDFQLKGGYILTAICWTEGSTEIDTDEILGIRNGRFRWGKKNWSKYASD
ncbi:hypothetical protein DFQ26_001475, partial [Actinomortierella ambigua]